MVAKPNPEISRYRSDLLEPSTVLELLLLDDLFIITSKLCLLLQSDCKDFKAKHDVVDQTLITVKEMSEDQNHARFKSLKKSLALMKKLHNFNPESIISKQLRVDNSVTVEHFYSSTTVPFIKALVEMKGAFSLDNIPVSRAMTCLNPDKISKENDEKFLDYGKNDILMLYDFYGKQRNDIFEGRRVTSLPILACAADSLVAQ